MTPIRILALVLGSALFFPVSCTGSLYAGTRIAAWLDTRDVARGDEVHRSFSVIVEPGVDGQPFRALRLYDLPRLLKEERGEREGRISLLPSKPAGRIANGKHGWISYRVLEDQSSSMVIEVEDNDGDRMAWSRYQVRRGEKGEGGVGPGVVAPLESRMFTPDHMVRALPWALGLAFLVYGLGRWLRRRQHGDGDDATA